MQIMGNSFHLIKEHLCNLYDYIKTGFRQGIPPFTMPSLKSSIRQRRGFLNTKYMKFYGKTLFIFIICILLLFRPTMYRLAEKGSITQPVNTAVVSTILCRIAVLCECWVWRKDFIDKCQDFGFHLSRAVQILAPSTGFLTERRNFLTLFTDNQPINSGNLRTSQMVKDILWKTTSHCISISIQLNYWISTHDVGNSSWQMNI